jgi:rare lipoprotein A
MEEIRNIADSFQFKPLKMNKFRILPVLFFFIFFSTSAQKGSTIRLKGRASYYGDDFHGKRTASGEKFDIFKFTAAHRTLPFGTKVKVTNLTNGKAVILKINDRGPHVKTRIIDLSKCAAQAIDLMRYGAAKVSLEVVNNEALSFGPYLPSYLASEVLNTALYFPGNMYNFWGHTKKLEGYGFQVAAYTDLISARETCQQLIIKGIKDVYIQVATLKDGKLYRVMLHQYPSRKMAEEEIACLHDLGLTGFIRSY